MNILITICGVILCINLLSVQSHYVYGENPNTGYVSLKGGDNFPIGFNGKQRKYMAYSNGQKNTVNERGNTKITISPYAESTAHDKRFHKTTASRKPTEPPKKQQRKQEMGYVRDSRNYKSYRGRNGQNYKQATKTNARVKEYTSQTKQYEQNFSTKGNTYDSKGQIVEVNVHKSQIPAEPQKVKLNSNRQVAALSVQRREDNYKKIPTSVLVDKTLQKTAHFKERNSQIMSRVLDDMTKKVSNRRHKNDYKKRDTVGPYNRNSNAKRNIVTDSIKKYIGKDSHIKMEKEHQPKDAPRIGSREEEIEENHVPYALFYRMSPESLDNQEGLYLMKAMEDEGETVFSPKEKRLTVNYQNEVDLKKTKTKKNFSTVKLRKKVKNLANFRSDDA